MSKKFDFSNTLITWYLKNKRQLPWRLTKDPYLIWLSEIILQQTRISQGTSYYLKFSKHFQNIFQMANADEELILKLWQGLGYYPRARNMHHTAKFISTELNGVFPNNYSDLIRLKGIGDYTASAILSICFNQPFAVVDGNVYRVLSRFFNISTPINSGQGKTEFKNLTQNLIDKNNPGIYNQALMELGALICTPKKPKCDICPLQLKCLALLQHRINLLPVKKAKPKLKKRHFNFLVFISEGKYTVLHQRKEKDIWRNLFEFPLIESKENMNESQIRESTLFREIIGQNNFKIIKHNKAPIVQNLTHQKLNISFWVIHTNQILKNSILYEKIGNFAVPVVIQNFVDKFKISS